MKRITLYILVGIFSYLVFMLLLFPASLAWYLARDEFQQQLPHWQLTGVQGSVWRGRADSLGHKNTPLGSLSWRLAALPLLRARINSQFSLQSEHGHLQGKLAAPLSADELTLSRIEGRFPIQEFSRFLTTTLPARADGSVSINLVELVLNKQGMPRAVQGTLIWHQASVVVNEAIVPLGDIRIRLHSDNDGLIHATINDNGGPLSIEASVQLQPDGSYRLEGNLAAAEGATEGLKFLLSWLGHVDNYGRYRLNYSGRIKL